LENVYETDMHIIITADSFRVQDSQHIQKQSPSPWNSYAGLTLSLPDRKKIIPPKTANTAGNIISYTTVISIAYLVSPDLSGTLGMIYFLRRKHPACKAAKGLKKDKVRLVILPGSSQLHCDMSSHCRHDDCC